MARIFIEGFEGGDFGNLDSTSGGPLIIAAPSGMSGSYAFRASTNKWIYKAFSPTLTEVYFSERVKCINSASYGSIFRLTYGSLIPLEVCVGPSRYVTVWKRPDLINPTTRIIGQSSYPLDLNVVYHIEGRILLGPVSGIVQVKINNIMEIDFTGNTTSTAGETDYNGFWVGSWVGAEYQYDDIVVDNAAWIGPSRIALLKPTGAGALTQFTPSAGANWDCVDEIPASDSDYVATDTPGNVDLYTLTDLPGETVTVKSVQLSARCYKESGATPQNLQMSVRSNGSNYFSGNKPIPDTVGVNVIHLFETNPDTGIPWTVGQGNALEAGMKAVT